jgi:glycosyltransferase involved in cell wall biosynthesis
VVIPLYNGAATIHKALESLSNQTRRPDHVVVVDDGSSDLGPQIVREYQALYPLTLLQQSNQGPSAARNRGLFHAGETLIAFLDADDHWHPQKLQKQLDLYAALTGQGHPVGLIDCFERSLFSDGKEHLADRLKGGEHFDDFIRANVVNGTSCVLVVREIIMRLGGFDTSIRFAEDRWLWTQVAEHWEIHTVPEVLSQRWIGSGNITSHPHKYYPHKVRFIELYLERYGARLSKQQRIDFALANHVEFLNAFSRTGAYGQVVNVFQRMLGHSWQALIFLNGKPTLRYLHARVSQLRKAS